MTANVIFDASDIVGESIVYDDRRDALLLRDRAEARAAQCHRSTCSGSTLPR